jgi:superfamily II DNA helicase RecQ
MQLRFFQVPAHDASDVEDELNRFLRSHRIVTIDRHFVADGINSSWAISVTYLEQAARAGSGKRSKVDYREVLSEADFALFTRLRDLRKRLAAETGVPVYALFTNEQLAAIAEQRPTSLDELKAIDGVGEARIATHGPAVLSVLQQLAPVDRGREGASHAA